MLFSRTISSEGAIHFPYLFLLEKNVNGYLSIGRPVSNNEIYILDEQLRCVKLGDLGEIYTSGANVVKQYLQGE